MTFDILENMITNTTVYVLLWIFIGLRFRKHEGKIEWRHWLPPLSIKIIIFGWAFSTTTYLLNHLA